MPHKGKLRYHLVWCPKYRRPVLDGAVGERAKELIYEKAEANGYKVQELEIMPDHVQLFVEAPATESVHRIVNQFKGFLSRTLREEYPHLKKRLPSLWTRSYYAGSVGQMSEATVRKYIQQQRRS